MTKHTLQSPHPSETSDSESPSSEGIFSNAISAAEFMKQIRAIQQSTKKQDQDLRDGARRYMNSLHSVQPEEARANYRKGKGTVVHNKKELEKYLCSL